MTQTIETSSPTAQAPAREPRVRGLVSVVIPAYNAAQSLARCIENVLNQTYPHIELIVINDGSTDDTDTVARSFGDRIRYVSQANRGETATRNRGFEMSKGEFLTFVDHDDYWDPHFIESCANFLRDHEDAIAVCVGNDYRTALRPDDTHTRPAFLAPGAPPSEFAKKPFVLERFFDFWFEHEPMHPGGAMIRGDVIDRSEGQRDDLVISGDMEYWAYLATFGKWGFVPRVLLHIDGSAVPKGKLYQKFLTRFRRCPTIESWESRVWPRLDDADRPGFAKIRGRVATTFVFANIYAGNDAEARRLAAKYAPELEGKFGKLWRLGLKFGPIGWWMLCRAVRLRTWMQYSAADRRLPA